MTGSRGRLTRAHGKSATAEEESSAAAARPGGGGQFRAYRGGGFVCHTGETKQWLGLGYGERGLAGPKGSQAISKHSPHVWIHVSSDTSIRILKTGPDMYLWSIQRVSVSGVY
jgi:hypothetical protein